MGRSAIVTALFFVVLGMLTPASTVIAPFGVLPKCSNGDGGSPAKLDASTRLAYERTRVAYDRIVM